jgi:hypothetical protein
MKPKNFALSVVLLFSCSSGVWAEDGTFSVLPMVDHTSGRYGTAKSTDITTTSLLGKYQTELWTLKLTLPYLYVRGGAGVIPGVGTAQNNNPRQRREGSIESGMGDIVAATTYAAYFNDATDFGMDLTAKVKFGTADRDKGLGTGENDYSGQLDIYKSISNLTVFGGIGYSVLGNSQYIVLHNVYNATIGASYAGTEFTKFGVSYDAQERASPSSGPVSEATASISYKISPRWKTQAYVLKGFAAGSPDWGAGASLGYSF